MYVLRNLICYFGGSLWIWDVKRTPPSHAWGWFFNQVRSLGCLAARCKMNRYSKRRSNREGTQGRQMDVAIRILSYTTARVPPVRFISSTVTAISPETGDVNMLHTFLQSGHPDRSTRFAATLPTAVPLVNTRGKVTWKKQTVRNCLSTNDT